MNHLTDENVYFSITGDDGPSGFGFELTFRLKRGPNENSPPTWPAELMQNLARYVFHSGMSLGYSLNFFYFLVQFCDEIYKQWRTLHNLFGGGGESIKGGKAIL